MAEGGPDRHGDDLANVDHMKRHRFLASRVNSGRDPPSASGRPVK